VTDLVNEEDGLNYQLLRDAVNKAAYLYKDTLVRFDLDASKKKKMVLMV